MEALPDAATLEHLRALGIRYVVVRDWAAGSVWAPLLDPASAAPLRHLGTYDGDVLYEVPTRGNGYDAPPHTRRSRPLRRLAAIAAGLVVGAFGVLALVFVFRGRLNGDEGWYLYGGRLAWRGQLPYKDFAFTQMPLSAYVYGMLQTVSRSVFLGRLTSVVFAVGAVALCTTRCLA